MSSFYIDYVSCCSRRKMDLERIRNFFLKNRFEEYLQPEDTDYNIAVCCSSTEANVNESICLIQKLSNANKENNGKLIVSGCMKHSKIMSVIHILPNVLSIIPPKDGLEKFDEIFKDASVKMRTIPNSIVLPNDTDTMILRCQWGCMGKCSYCVAKQSIGKTRSKSIEDCKREILYNLRPDLKKIRIMGDDIGSYGVDIGSNFGELIQAVDSVRNGNPLIIDNLDVRYLVDFENELIKLIEKNAIFHLQTPIQNTNIRILKLMNRYSEMERLKQTLQHMTQNIKLSIETHYIVGFPTEEINELIDGVIECLEEFPFNKVGFFPYLDNVDTVSYQLNSKVDNFELIRRMEIVKKIAEKYGMVEIRQVKDSDGLIEVRLTRKS